MVASTLNSHSKDSVTQTCFCLNCNKPLTYSLSLLIECPHCHTQFDPNQPRFMRCGLCKTLLKCSLNALFIKCPRCLQLQKPNESPYTDDVIKNQLEQNKQRLQKATTEHSHQNKQYLYNNKSHSIDSLPKRIHCAFSLYCLDVLQNIPLEHYNSLLTTASSSSVTLFQHLSNKFRLLSAEQQRSYQLRAYEQQQIFREQMNEASATEMPMVD